jgi:outer membrane protein OmpA-like peptidoglycan-associated protein
MKTTDALTGKELKAKSDVTGTYTYSPAAGTKMPAGMHNLKVMFTPRDQANYMSATTNVNVMVVKDVNKFEPIKVPFTMSSAGLTAVTRPMVSKIFLNNDVSAVTVYGYVQPSNNKAADMKLSLQRAQTVAKQLKSISPSLKITIKAMGASINSACKAELNKCVIVK